MKEALIGGSDTRKKVENSEEYPYCCIGLITGKFGSSFYHGSGCLIGPRIVLTCAHNLYYREQEEEAVELEYTPTVNGDQRESIKIKKCYFPQTYKTTKEEKLINENDIGLLELEKDIEETYGYLGIDAEV